MSACNHSYSFSDKALLPALALILASCGTGNSAITPENTHGQEAVETADELDALEAATDNSAQEGNELPDSENPGTGDNQNSGSDSDPAPDTDNGNIDVAGYENAEAVGCDAAAEAMQASILRRVNEARTSAQQCGATSYSAGDPLTWNTRLADAAKNHANDMAGNNFFGHTGTDGLKVDNRVENSGYLWLSVGENIAAGQRDTDTVVQGWIDSEGHCANIMDPTYTEVAVSCTVDENADYSRYWVMVLGAPLPRN